MSKKVLIVEASLAVRNIAESLLRQNGFEVVSAETDKAAYDILKSSRIDLIMAASEIPNDKGGQFYEALGANSETASLPLLILHDPSGGDLAYPPEAIINKPFTPREFLDKVNAFTGGKTPLAPVEVAPFSDNTLDDELIDQALGLDKLEVDKAEVIGNDSGVFRIMNKRVTEEKMLGFDYKTDEDSSITNKKDRPIDQVNIPADQKKDDSEESDKPEFLGQDSKKVKIGREEGMSESSKIEIIPDQYGIVDPHQFDSVHDSANSEHHDYNWFINEMQKEARAPSVEDSGPLDVESPSQNMEPVAPASTSDSDAKREKSPKKTKAEPGAKKHGQAVDKFISEFKKEMEKIADDASPELSEIPVTRVAPDKKTSSHKGDTLKWEEALEKITPAEIRLISEELVNAIAGRIARQIAAKLDPDTVYRILRECLNDVMGRSPKSKSPQPR